MIQKHLTTFLHHPIMCINRKFWHPYQHLFFAFQGVVNKDALKNCILMCIEFCSKIRDFENHFTVNSHNAWFWDRPKHLHFQVCYLLICQPASIWTIELRVLLSMLLLCALLNPLLSALLNALLSVLLSALLCALP